jgi:DNA-directed RNA polymerase specialized sigma24 family protein
MPTGNASVVIRAQLRARARMLANAEARLLESIERARVEGLSLRAIGAEIGVSAEGVRKMLARADAK